MKNTFQAKIDDFVKWCELAFTHYQNGYYADSLTNMRKSGEAACKLMIIHRFTEKVAQDKIADKSYKELIQLIIRHSIAPRSVINWLEALQIHGNIATHDNDVMKEQAHYGITALRLLVQWLFEDFLKIPVPASLEEAMSQTSRPVKTAADSKKLKTELHRLKEEKQGLQNRLQSMEGKTEEEAEKTGQLQKELNEAEFKIKEMELLRQKAALLEKERVLAHRQQEQAAEKSVKKLLNKKVLIGVPAAIVLLIGGWFFIDKILSGTKTAEEPQEEILIAENTLQPDTLKVLILPLTVLQDNPNMTLKVENAMEGRIRQRIIERQLPLSVHFNSGFSKTSLTLDDALQAGKKEEAGLVFYGELYEPTTAEDSVRIDLKYALTREEGKYSGYITIKAFKTLTDSAFMHLQTQVETVLDFALADRYIDRKKYSDALAQLYETKGYGKGGKASIHNMRATCYYNLQDYPSAMREMEQYIELYPEDAYGYAFLANVLKQAADFEGAKANYEISLRMEPGNVFTLLNYADLLAIESQPQIYNIYKSKELVLRALEYDSTVSTGWRYLGDIEYSMENYTAARVAYRKCLSLDSTGTAAKKSLAKILAFDFNQPEEAEKLLSEVLQKDSADAAALFILGNIYTSTSLKKPKLAEYLIKKSEEQYPEAEYAHHYGKGLAAHQLGKLDSALTYYLAAFAIDSSDLTLSNNIAQLYIDMQDIIKAITFSEHSYRLDSMSHMTNYNLGIIYYFGAQKGIDMNKAKFYFERALKTNPYDTLNLEYLAAVHYHLGNIKRSEELFLQLCDINPFSYYGNKYLGILTENKGEYGKARTHYENALKTNPKDDELWSKIAYVLVAESTANVYKALPYAKKALDLNPGSANNIYILSQMYIHSKDYPKAADFYYRAIRMQPSLKDPYMEEVLKKAGY